jgi:hypothetical protein
LGRLRVGDAPRAPVAVATNPHDPGLIRARSKSSHPSERVRVVKLCVGFSLPQAYISLSPRRRTTHRCEGQHEPLRRRRRDAAMRLSGEYRTARLTLAAWDRLAPDFSAMGI